MVTGLVLAGTKEHKQREIQKYRNSYLQKYRVTETMLYYNLFLAALGASFDFGLCAFGTQPLQPTHDVVR